MQAPELAAQELKRCVKDLGKPSNNPGDRNISRLAAVVWHQSNWDVLHTILIQIFINITFK